MRFAAPMSLKQNLLDGLRLNLHLDSLRENSRKLSFYLRGSDRYWQVSAPLSPPSDLLAYYPLDFSVQLHCGHYHQLDASGIPIRRSSDGSFFVHNYTRICGFALAHWNLYLRTGDEAHTGPLLAAADYILRTAEWKHASAAVRTEIPAKGHVGALSAMSQGQAISVLCRAWQQVRKADYRDTAIALLGRFEVPVNDGGLVGHLSGPGLPWFEEYPTPPLDHVLNGMIFALWGLQDLATSVGSRPAQRLYQQGVESVARALPVFDSGYWSWYSVGEDRPPYIASMMYHNLHVALLQALFQQTQRDEFLYYGRKFRGYANRYQCRLRAAIELVAEKYRRLREISPARTGPGHSGSDSQITARAR